MRTAEDTIRELETLVSSLKAELKDANLRTDRLREERDDARLKLREATAQPQRAEGPAVGARELLGELRGVIVADWAKAVSGDQSAYLGRLVKEIDAAMEAYAAAPQQEVDHDCLKEGCYGPEGCKHAQPTVEGPKEQFCTKTWNHPGAGLVYCTRPKHDDDNHSWSSKPPVAPTPAPAPEPEKPKKCRINKGGGGDEVRRLERVWIGYPISRYSETWYYECRGWQRKLLEWLVGGFTKSDKNCHTP